MKILLVDDHALFRHGLLLLLSKMDGSHQFLEAENCESAFAQAQSHEDMDLIVLDLALPGMNGLDGMVRMRELCPTTPIVLVSAIDNPQFVIDGMQRGAQGFIPKSATPEAMLGAVQAILAGGTYVPALDLGDKPASGGPSTLTGRQREVLALLVQGRSNKEIADALEMRVNTVRVHVAAILRALGVENRTDAARAALGFGLIPEGR